MTAVALTRRSLSVLAMNDRVDGHDETADNFLGIRLAKSFVVTNTRSRNLASALPEIAVVG